MINEVHENIIEDGENEVHHETTTSCQNNQHEEIEGTLPEDNQQHQQEQSGEDFLFDDPNFTNTTFLQICHFPAGMSFFSVSRHMSKQAISGAISTGVYLLTRMMALSTVGRTQSTLTLSSCAVGISTYNVLSNSIGIGWCSAIDTLVSAAYGRLQKNAATEEEVGEITQLGLGMGLILATLTSTFIFFFSSSIITSVFGEEYLEGASEFLIHIIPCIFANTVGLVINKSLQAQHLAEVPSKAAISGLIATVIGAETLIPRYGVKGCAWTLLLSNIAQLCTCLAIAPETALFRKVPWFPPTRWRQIFTWARIKEYNEIALFSSVGVCVEFWAFESLYVTVAHLGERRTAAFGVFFNLVMLCLSLGAGVATATYSHTGKLLGQNLPNHAKIVARTGIIWGWIAANVAVLIVVIFNDLIFRLYTSDEDLLKELRGLLFLFWIFHQCDSTQYTIQSVFRATGRQSETVKPVLVSLWMIGLPGAYFFSKYASTFNIDPLHALFIGFLLSFVLEIPLLLRQIVNWDWKEIAEKASRERNNDNDNNVDAGTEEMKGEPEKTQEKNSNGILVLGGDGVNNTMMVSNDDDTEDKKMKQ